MTIGSLVLMWSKLKIYTGKELKHSSGRKRPVQFSTFVCGRMLRDLMNFNIGCKITDIELEGVNSLSFVSLHHSVALEEIVLKGNFLRDVKHPKVSALLQASCGGNCFIG